MRPAYVLENFNIQGFNELISIFKQLVIKLNIESLFSLWYDLFHLLMFLNGCKLMCV